MKATLTGCQRADVPSGRRGSYRLLVFTICALLLIACVPEATTTPSPALPPSPSPLAVSEQVTAAPAPPATAAPTRPTGSPGPPTPSAAPPAAIGSASSGTPAQPDVAGIIAELQGLEFDPFVDESYKQLLLRNPEGLTIAGVSEQFGLRNDRLNNLSNAFIRDTQKLEDAILERLRGYDRAGLSAEQQVTYDVYEWYLDSQARGHDLTYCEYPIHHMVGSYDIELIRLFTEIQPMTGVRDVEDYVARLSQVDDQVAQLMEGLKLRQRAGAIPPRFMIELVLPNLQAIANSPAVTTPFFSAFSQKLVALKGMSDADRQAWRAAAETEIDRSVLPAFQRLVAYFQGLKSRATDDAGLWRLSNGEACYAYLLRRETSTDLTPDQVHDIGLAEVARIQAEMRRAFDRLGYPSDAGLGELMNRAIEEGGLIDTRSQAGKDQAVAAYEGILDKISGRLSAVMALSPRGRIVVVGDPLSGGFYVPGARDGSRPGAFHAYVGGSWLAKYSMATTAYHEAIPGHGFQGVIGQELDLPVLRTDVFFNGYAEGWALYSERLAWEMGMYDDDPYGNLGRLQLELLRAVRLVTDTGIHAKRWTREEAKAYMNEALGDPSGGWAGEADRYVARPAQATGYMIGMIKILEMRQKAMDALGDRFDLKEFHTVVLGNGMVPLALLERLVDEYIAAHRG